MLLSDSANLGGLYVPQGNDSFYHARRILEAVSGAGFYEFDERLHAPDGRFVPWPWAYDYLMAAVARVALWVNPQANPLAVPFFVPVVWVLVNSALFLGVTGELRLSLEMRTVAMICFALSPFTQLLHAFGMIDHHYVEHTFVLLGVWLGLRWFRDKDDTRWPVALGSALGVAPGFHTGLFVLLLLPLATIFLLWVRGLAPARVALSRFVAALLLSMQVVLWPSAPFRAGIFDFGLLSWFHLYAGVCTCVCVLFMGRWGYSVRALAVLLAIAALLAIPLVEQAVRGAAFVTGGISVLDDVVEAQSIYAQLTRSFGVAATASFYTWLLALMPALLAWYAYRIAVERSADRLYYAIAVVFGLALMAAQFRFHYFGLFALVTGGLVLVDRCRRYFGWHRGAVLIGVLLVVVGAYQPALRHRLFENYLPGIDAEYASTLPLYLRLGRECEQDPGVVLATNNDGNPILFHTACGVITNNFILSRADDEHLRRAGRLLRLPPDQLRQAAPEVRYLLLRADDFTVVEGGQRRLMTEIPVVTSLLLPVEAPLGFELVYALDRVAGASGPENVYAKLFKIRD